MIATFPHGMKAGSVKRDCVRPLMNDGFARVRSAPKPGDGMRRQFVRSARQVSPAPSPHRPCGGFAARWGEGQRLAPPGLSWAIAMKNSRRLGSQGDIRVGEDQFFFESDFATSRAQSTKSFTAGLIVRFFKVTMPMGPGWIGRSTGTAFNPRRLPLIRRVDADATARKRPVWAMA